MTIDEFEPDDVLAEISRKLANVSLNKLTLSDDDLVSRENLPTIKHYMQYSDPRTEECFQSVQMIRRYLTQANSTPQSVEDILDLDILPRLRSLMAMNGASNLQFECAWIITNIAAGSSLQTKRLVDADMIDVLLDCVRCDRTSSSVKAQAAWALSNFAGESADLRETLISKNALTAVSMVLSKLCNDVLEDAAQWVVPLDEFAIDDTELCTDIKALTWTISNMARGGFRTADYWKSYVPAFTSLTKCIRFDHTSLWIDGCWGISRILNNMHDVTEFYNCIEVTHEFCTRLVYLVDQCNYQVTLPVLRTIISITSSPIDLTGNLLSTGVLSALAALMTPCTPSAIRRDVLLILSNLAADTLGAAQAVMDDEPIMASVISCITVPGHQYSNISDKWIPNHTRYHLNFTEEWKITTEALWIICNLMVSGTDNGILSFFQHHRELPKIIGVLLSYDPSQLPQNTITKALDTLTEIINRTNKVLGVAPLGTCPANPFVNDLNAMGLSEFLQTVCAWHNRAEHICNRAEALIRLLDTPQSQGTSNLAAMFGLQMPRHMNTGANKRRVLYGLEDGDVRLIENAVGKLSI